MLLRKKLAVVLVAMLMLALSSAPAFAAANPSGTGPPSQSCEDPANAGSGPPGFDSGGFKHAQDRYNEEHSQYDVACFQRAQNGR